MDLIIAPTSYPIRWSGSEHLLVEAGIKDGSAYAMVTPRNPDLEDAIRKKLERVNGLPLILRSGFCELG